MLEMISQIEAVWAMVGGGSLGIGVGGLSIWLFKRTLNKTLNHVDEKVCRVQHRSLDRRLDEMHKDIKDLCKFVKEKKE